MVSWSVVSEARGQTSMGLGGGTTNPESLLGPLLRRRRTMCGT